MRFDFLIGTACGAAAALIGASVLFGAKGHMESASDAFGTRGAYYVVGKKPLDYFGKSGPNCWGGHTLDGRCISLVVSSGDFEPSWTTHFGPECDPPHQCDKHGFLIASAEAKRKVAKSCPNANPLYVERYGYCPR